MVLCWNGIAYQPITIGEKADLAKFVEEQLTGPGNRAVRPSEWQGEPANSRTLLGAAFALRVGRADVAECIVGALKQDTKYEVLEFCNSILVKRDANPYMY